MWWSIVVTGNHFFFDMAVGAVLVLLALFLSFRLESWLESGGPRRLTVRVGGHRLPI
jgi:hypothetical protein